MNAIGLVEAGIGGDAHGQDEAVALAILGGEGEPGGAASIRCAPISRALSAR